MLAIDTNILVHAHRREPEEHDRARQLLAGLAAGSDAWAIVTRDRDFSLFPELRRRDLAA